MEREKGMLLVISGPSGVGKSTVYCKFLAERSDFDFSVSATTRAMRQGEVEGRDYYFKSQEEFRRLVEEDAFVEWAENFGNCYGTLKSEVERITAAGRNVFFDVDVKGALNIMKLYPEALTVFIYPESMAELESRLRSRGTDSEEAVLRRLGEAKGEIAQMYKYKYALCNYYSPDTAVKLNELFERESSSYRETHRAIAKLCAE